MVKFSIYLNRRVFVMLFLYTPYYPKFRKTEPTTKEKGGAVGVGGVGSYQDDF